MSRGVAAVLAAAVIGLGACSDDPVAPTIQVIEEVTFDPSLGIDLADYTELPEGVWIRDFTVGTGDAFAAGGDATVNYTGWLTNGAEFDSGSFSFPDQFGGRPILGFELGLDGTQIDGVRRMIIPPELGYGRWDYGPIPGGSILIFEVELVSLTN